MALDFADVLADKTKYPDNLEIPIGDEKVPLATLRSLNQRTQDQLTEQINNYKTREAETRELASKAADLIANAEKLNERVEKPAPKPDEWESLYDTDPSYSPVRKRLSAQEERINKALETLASQQKSLESAAMIFAKRMWREDFKENRERLKGEKYKDYRDPDKLANYAAQQHLVDENGIPSVARAIEHLTREDEIARIKEEAKAEGVREGRLAARMGSMQRPTSASGPGGSTPDFALDPGKNFEDLGDKAMEDPATRELLAALGDMDPNDFRPQ
jgi:hypothetical protein